MTFITSIHYKVLGLDESQMELAFASIGLNNKARLMNCTREKLEDFLSGVGVDVISIEAVIQLQAWMLTHRDENPYAIDEMLGFDNDSWTKFLRGFNPHLDYTDPQERCAAVDLGNVVKTEDGGRAYSPSKGEELHSSRLT